MSYRMPGVLLVVVVFAAACSSAPTGAASAPSASPAPLSEIAQLGVSTTKGEPLIDPAELIQGANFDGIPAVDRPITVTAGEAAVALADDEQLMLVDHGGEAKAYPVRSLIRHEIFNDAVGGLPVAVTWCPLCNTGITFDRRVNGRAEVFGVSGGLYRSALVMFDRRTTSLWPQPLGRAVLGPLLGAELEVVASSLLPWREIREAYPQVQVVLGSRDELEETTNPYDGYDVSDRPFLFQGEVDKRLPAFARVAGVSFGGQAQAWSYDVLRRQRVIRAKVGDQRLVVLWAPGSASPLETDDVRKGRDVGSTGVYDPVVDGRTLTFSPAGQRDFKDGETGSRWSLTGLAVDGPLAGRRLTALAHQDAFWFAWAAFQPGTSLVKQ